MADTSNYQSLANIPAVSQGLVPSAGNGISPGGVPTTTQYSMTAAGVVMNSVSNLSSPIIDAAASAAIAAFIASTDPFVSTDNRQSNPAQKTAESQQDTSGGQTIQYPKDLPKYYMKLSVYDYVRQTPLASTLKKPKYTIALPLPDGEGLVDNTSTQWNDSALTHWGNALENSTGIQSIIRGFLNNRGIQGEQPTQNTQNMVGGTAGDIAVYVADAAARTASAELAGTIESQTGLAPNPALAMTFKQVDFRKFQFTWLLSARNKDETDIIKNIVVALKQAQLPSFSARSTAIFEYPSIVTPAIVPEDTAKYMTDFKPSVITAVNVRYSPVAKAPSFYSTTGAPVFVELSIALEEMQIRLPGDYTSNTDIALNKPNSSNNTASQTSGRTLGGAIDGNGAPAPAAKPPATNDNPTDPGAARATDQGAARTTGTATVPFPIG
jgi:hypothetical protein